MIHRRKMVSHGSSQLAQTNYSVTAPKQFPLQRRRVNFHIGSVPIVSILWLPPMPKPKTLIKQPNMRDGHSTILRQRQEKNVKSAWPCLNSGKHFATNSNCRDDGSSCLNKLRSN